FSELDKVVNLPVEHHPDCLLLVRHGLVTAAQIDDRQTPEAKSNRPSQVKPLIIRSPVCQRSCRLHDLMGDNGLHGPKVKLAVDAAHAVLALPGKPWWALSKRRRPRAD